MSEVVKLLPMWVVALIVLGFLLFFVFSALFGVFIGRNICKTLGSFVWRSLAFGGLITGTITDIGVSAACDLIPF